MAGLLLFVLLLVQTLAASDSLHADVHADAGAADHQCVVTVFADGQVDLNSPAIVCAVPEPVITAQCALREIFLGEPSQYLLPSRGPPSLA